MMTGSHIFFHSLFFLSFFTSAPAQDPPSDSSSKSFIRSCFYDILGGDLSWTGEVELENGGKWEVVKDGPLRFLTLSFPTPVRLSQISIHLRVNNDIRVVTYDGKGRLLPRFYNVRAGNKRPFKTKLSGNSPVGKVLFQGFDAELTADEIKAVRVVACSAEDCEDPGPCYGQCQIKVKNHCLVCNCPRGSPSSGCQGYSDQEKSLLDTLTTRKVRGCKTNIGYRRVVDRSEGVDECQEYEYPRCPFYQSTIIVPRSRIQCLKYCY